MCRSLSGGDVFALDVVALGAELGDGGVEIAGVPQDDGVEDQAERGKLVLLALAVCLADLPAPAVADRAGEPVAGLLHGPTHIGSRPGRTGDRCRWRGGQCPLRCSRPS